MVNTFLICASFEESMRQLDWRRLGKQRVEALQIYNALRRSHIIAKFLSLPVMPSLQDYPGFDGDFLREQWYTTVYKCYRDSGQTFYEKETSFGYEYSKHPYFQSKPIGSGFVMHTACLMWIGYEQALKYYINAAIREWQRRGHQNTMKEYLLFEDEIHYPWWVFSEAFHNSNKSALLRKEIVRKEEKWYQHFLSVSKEWLEQGYLWPSHLSPAARKEVLAIPSAKWCDPIRNDFL